MVELKISANLKHRQGLMKNNLIWHYKPLTYASFTLYENLNNISIRKVNNDGFVKSPISFY